MLYDVRRDVANTVKARLARILQIDLVYVYILTNSNKRKFFCIILSNFRIFVILISVLISGVNSLLIN